MSQCIPYTTIIRWWGKKQTKENVRSDMKNTLSGSPMFAKTGKEVNRHEAQNIQF
jgi:hypothetical protein